MPMHHHAGVHVNVLYVGSCQQEGTLVTLKGRFWLQWFGRVATGPAGTGHLEKSWPRSQAPGT